MGKPRATSGSAFFHEERQVWYAILTLERGKRGGKRKWERIPVEPGEKISQEDADAYAADLQARVDAGWDPNAKVEPTPAAVLTPAFCDAWGKARTYDSGPKDHKSLNRYLPRSPLARLAVRDLRARHIVAFIEWMKIQPSARGGTLAPRTIRNVVDALRRALDRAVVEELLTSNPVDPVRGEVPEIADKDPSARDSWEYPWAEAARLIYRSEVPPERRVWNALAFGTGARPSELAVLRWRDWERDAEPLSRLNVRRARKSVSRKEGATKTFARKPCPVVPALVRILDAWHRIGWREVYGRDPTPDDLIVPSRRFTPLDEHHTNKRFQADCEAVGVRVLHQYTTRHTWITRVQNDGAESTVVQWVTHAPPKSAWNGYTRADWTRLCTEVAKLRFPVGVDVGVDSLAKTPSPTDGSTEESKVSDAVPMEWNGRVFVGSTGRVETDSDASKALALTPATPRSDVITLDALARWQLDEDGASWRLN